MVMAETNLVALTEGLLAVANTTPEPQAQAELRPVFEKLVALMQRSALTPRRQDPGAAHLRGRRQPDVRPVSIPRSGSRSTPRLIKQLPAAPPAGTWVECTNGTGPAEPCAQFMLAHHLAKVLAYTGEPDVIGRILAIMPKGDEDQPGQIDLMYSLRILDAGWTKEQKQQAIDWFAQGIEMARRLHVRRPREQHLRRDHRRVHGGRKTGGLPGGAAVRADHRDSGGRRGAADARPRAAVGAADAAAGRACRSTARSATTTSCSRAAAGPARWPGAAARRIPPKAGACSATPARSATASAPSARTTRLT